MPTLTITVSAGGTTVPTPGAHEYVLNSVVSGITALAYPGYSFVRWLLDGAELLENPTSLIMDADHALQAEFTGAPPQHSLTVTATSGGVTEPASGTHLYDEGAVVSVQATPLEGYRFMYWLRDGVEVTDNPITVVMNTDHTVEAVFKLIVVTLPEEPWTPICLVAGLEAAGVMITIIASFLFKGEI